MYLKKMGLTHQVKPFAVRSQIPKSKQRNILSFIFEIIQPAKPTLKELLFIRVFRNGNKVVFSSLP